jgi:hypothetical protein
MDQQSLKNEQYRLERLGKEALKRGDKQNYLRYGNEALDKVYKHLKMPQSEAPGYVFRTHISKELIQRVFGSGVHVFPRLARNRVPACVSYVEILLETDLKPVEIVFTKGDFNQAEGRAQPCADSEHFVILPYPEDDFTSEELLVHELGHTAEYMRRRPTEEYGYYSSHRLFSEAIAHFAQFHYLTDHGTQEQRVAVIGSLLRDYMIMKALDAMLEISEDSKTLDVRQAITKEPMSDLLSIYGKAKTLDILMPFNNAPFWVLYYNLVEPRMGFVLALKLFNDKEAILKLTTVKQDRPLKQTLDELGLNGEELMDFSQADELLKKFINKTL